MRNIVNNILVLTFSIVFCLLMLEGLVRVAITFDLGNFRNPDAYLSSLSDDDYWKLRLLWTDYAEAPKEGIHPELGWTPRTSDQNPLGLVAETDYIPNYRAQSILFFGDSYVAALTDPADAIPQQMRPHLTPYEVHNFGVPGYGVGQTYLRLRENTALFDQPIVLFGILTFDLDRTILDVRAGPKPRLSFTADGELLVQNVPIEQTAAEWIEDNPPQTRSYLWAFISRTRDQIQASQAGLAFGAESRVDEKQIVNAQIMQHATQHAQDQGFPLIFVIFYARSEFENDSWRERFLRDQCTRLTCIDTKEALETAAQEANKAVDDYYLPDGLHLNETGNAIVAAYISEELSLLVAEFP